MISERNHLAIYKFVAVIKSVSHTLPTLTHPICCSCLGNYTTHYSASKIQLNRQDYLVFSTGPQNGQIESVSPVKLNSATFTWMDGGRRWKRRTPLGTSSFVVGPALHVAGNNIALGPIWINSIFLSFRGCCSPKCYPEILQGRRCQIKSLNSQPASPRSPHTRDKQESAVAKTKDSVYTCSGTTSDIY